MSLKSVRILPVFAPEEARQMVIVFEEWIKKRQQGPYPIRCNVCGADEERRTGAHHRILLGDSYRQAAKQFGFEILHVHYHIIYHFNPIVIPNIVDDPLRAKIMPTQDFPINEPEYDQYVWILAQLQQVRRLAMGRSRTKNGRRAQKPDPKTLLEAIREMHRIIPKLHKDGDGKKEKEDLGDLIDPETKKKLIAAKAKREGEKTVTVEEVP